MLQAIQAVHNLSVAYPSAYFGSLLVVLLIVLRGWYVLGTGAGPRLSVPLRLGWKFTKASRMLLFQIANLAIVGQIVSSEDTIGTSIALKVT